MPVSTFSLSTERRGDVTVVSVGGELDLATVEALETSAFHELARPECRTLVFDLGELTFVDSSGINGWLQVRNRARAHGQRVVLRSVPPAVARLLEIGGLSQLFADQLRA
jgi:anti-sigma B factor antagonist